MANLIADRAKDECHRCLGGGGGGRQKINKEWL